MLYYETIRNNKSNKYCCYKNDHRNKVLSFLLDHRQTAISNVGSALGRPPLSRRYQLLTLTQWVESFKVYAGGYFFCYNNAVNANELSGAFLDSELNFLLEELS